MTQFLSEILQTIQRESTISFPFLGIYDLDPPAFFLVFGHKIYLYGVLIAAGFLVAGAYCSRAGKRFGISSDDFYDLMIWLIPIVIVCARLYYVLFRLEDFRGRPLSVFAVWEGGLAIYGGIIGGVATAYFVCRHKKIPPAAMLDLCIYGLLIGQIIGRWGNFMNREAFGAETTVFCRMGLTDPGGHTIYVHPTFLYESLWNLIGLIALIIWERKGHRHYDGQAFLLYLLWYGLGRAWIEGLRTDSLYIGHTGLRVSQLLSAGLCLGALALLAV
ncbi:MAG: prolipoprotein diacylglyceryl transferase, partial [Oscillospiraceae bacterium]|nr:prolipoprotein diacylglyceryl transferase [Oscillospiraceae bacterium]